MKRLISKRKLAIRNAGINSDKKLEKIVADVKEKHGSTYTVLLGKAY